MSTSLESTCAVTLLFLFSVFALFPENSERLLLYKPEAFTPQQPKISEILLVNAATTNFNGLVIIGDQPCKRLKKPFVRLPRGYDANAIEHKLTAQTAHRLDTL